VGWSDGPQNDCREVKRECTGTTHPTLFYATTPSTHLVQLWTNTCKERTHSHTVDLECKKRMARPRFERGSVSRPARTADQHLKAPRDEDRPGAIAPKWKCCLEPYSLTMLTITPPRRSFGIKSCGMKTCTPKAMSRSKNKGL
jgi:hypothetical protein